MDTFIELFQTRFVNVIQNKYADFEGRADRAEYWYFVLFNAMGIILLNVIESVARGSSVNVLVTLYSLGLFLPSLGVAVRRLHDTDRSPWLLLLFFIPVFGALVLLYFFIQPGTPSDNQYGPPSKTGL